MKIISKTKQDKILKLVSACQIMAFEIKDVETFCKMTENLASITYLIGGEKGQKKVFNTVLRRKK